MKFLFKGVLYSITLILVVGFSSIFYLGLDDNGPDSLDSALETKQVDEEIGFEQVAAVIRAFVHKQFQVRHDQVNLSEYKEELQRGKNGEYSNVYKDLPGQGPYATRDVHRKTHGCYKAQLNVSKSLLTQFNKTIYGIHHDRQLETMNNQGRPGPLPEVLANVDDLGVFQPGQEYDAIVRYSNGHPMNRHDKMPDARGFAVKVLNTGSMDKQKSLQDQDIEQLNSGTMLDILSINFPTFFVNERETSVKYTEINEYFLSGAIDFGSPLTGKLKEGLSLFTTGINAMEIRQAASVNGSIIKSPLYQEYFSMVPSRLGPRGSKRAVKYFWAPEACPGHENEFNVEKKIQWPDWANDRNFADPFSPLAKYETSPYVKKLASRYPHDYLRKNLETSLRQKDFCYALYFQPYRDQLSTNIEDSTDIWFRSEQERNLWKKTVVPGKFNPTWAFYGGQREAYLKKLDSKKIVAPIKAATLRIAKLGDQDIVGNSKVCEDLSFNPWNGNIEYHKPLGVISRLKRRVYNASRRVRHTLNDFKEFSFERKK